MLTFLFLCDFICTALGPRTQLWMPQWGKVCTTRQLLLGAPDVEKREAQGRDALPSLPWGACSTFGDSGD